MNGKALTFITFLLLATGVAFAQSGVITWQSETMKVLRTGEEFPFSSTFRIYPDDRIEWVQRDRTSTYTITSTQGTLTENAGSVTYQLTREGKSGKVVVERVSPTQTTLMLDLSGGTPVGAFCLFKVSNP